MKLPVLGATPRNQIPECSSGQLHESEIAGNVGNTSQHLDLLHRN